MSKIIMTQPLCAAGYEPLAKEGEIYVANNGNPSDYLDKLADAECIVVRIGHMNRAEMEAAPKLKVIGRSGIGYDSIDIEAANELGIPVVIAPHCNADSVAEHTLALMFALASNLVECHNEAVKGNFEIRNSGKGFELQGKTVGIIGFGDIGKRVGRLCRSIGMKLLAYDPYADDSEMESEGAGRCRILTQLLSESDVVTIHTPLNGETRGRASDDEILRPADQLCPGRHRGRGGTDFGAEGWHYRRRRCGCDRGGTPYSGKSPLLRPQPDHFSPQRGPDKRGHHPRRHHVRGRLHRRDARGTMAGGGKSGGL